MECWILTQGNKLQGKNEQQINNDIYETIRNLNKGQIINDIKELLWCDDTVFMFKKIALIFQRCISEYGRGEELGIDEIKLTMS